MSRQETLEDARRYPSAEELNRLVGPDDPTLPQPLLIAELGSFAYHTVRQRIPLLIRDVVAHNSFPSSIARRILAIEREITSRQPVRPLTEDAPDRDLWDWAWTPHQGKSWFELTWYFAEAYLHRRVLEATGYFQPGPWQGFDPYAAIKCAHYTEAGEAIAQFTSAYESLTGLGSVDAIAVLLHYNLWSNRADLSYRAVAERTKGTLDVARERQNLLIDDTSHVVALLSSGRLRRVDIIADNAGLELLYDLALADILIRRAGVQEVTFHLKAQPFYISDAMIADVYQALQFLAGTASNLLQTLAREVRGHIAGGRLRLLDHWFWTSPLCYQALWPSLQQELGRADLVVLKGDLNYRRLVGDRHWPVTARLAEVAAYFPAAFLTLRTMKAEVILDLTPERVNELFAEDPNWMVNGQRGLIQLVEPSKQTEGERC